jgi:iron(III) transport system substrate-binding protein
MEGTKHLDAAKKLCDWCASREANELYEKNFAIVAYPGVAKPMAMLPSNFEHLLVKQDLKWSAANRDRILAEWTKRYDGKSEKK